MHKVNVIESTKIKSAKEEVNKDKRQFILTWVQPGLAGLMDGSVSTLAPITPQRCYKWPHNLISWFSHLLELVFLWGLWLAR